MTEFSRGKIEIVPRVAEEAEPKEARRVFVEVGGGSLPKALEMARQEKSASGGDFKLVIDIDKKEIRAAKNISDRYLSKDRRLGFVAADAEALPLATESVDEFLFANVFGDPRISMDQKYVFFAEVKRALKEDGLMVLLETYTSSFAFEGMTDEKEPGSPFGPINYEAIGRLLSSMGFSVERLVREKDDDWQDLLMKYGRKPAIPEFNAFMFMFLLRKTKKQIK